MDAISADYLNGIVNLSQYYTGTIDLSQYSTGPYLDFRSTSSATLFNSEYYATYLGRPVFVSVQQQDDVVIDKEELEKLI